MHIFSFKVKPRIPDNLHKIEEIAWNLWCCWNWEAVQLFLRIDENLWIRSKQNPVRMLSLLPQQRYEELSNDESFIAWLNRVHNSFTQYINSKTWFSKNYGDIGTPTIAYFSLEYGIDVSLPIYSGGLGVLSGDHIKSASDLGLPLVGIGLHYRQGYFEQYLNIDGYQQEFYPENDWATMPVKRELDENGSSILIEIMLGDRTVKACIWRAMVGRVRLLFLDTNIPENPPEDRVITAQLYSGDRDMRIRQEILLGIGGIKALYALGLEPKVCHMNEGHSAFLGLERIRQLMERHELSFEEARLLIWSTNVFTTHTPVPAGNEEFEIPLLKHYFESYVSELGLAWDEFIEFGKENSHSTRNTFSMTVLALKLAAHANGVSKLHGKVSRGMWENMWENVPRKEIPIDHITNGIHVSSFLSHDMADLFDRYLGPDFVEKPLDEQVWDRIKNIPDAEIWHTHERRKERFISFVRRRLHDQLLKRGVSASEISYAEEVLDPKALTIGFSRRFTTYKRPALILRDPERLERILMNQDCSVQIIFAGKAHPADLPGKEEIRSLVHFAREERFRNRIVFIEDYDINVARYMVQGVDIWLNNPRRPLEASGTSGMKAAVNGAINVSTLDGWFDEAYTQFAESVGWKIGSGEEYRSENFDKQDEIESSAIYDILEREAIPMFYERSRDGLPRKWIAKMKSSMCNIGRIYNSHRMVAEYSKKCYIPAAINHTKLTTDNLKLLKELTRWEENLTKNWETLKFAEISADTTKSVNVGEKLTVTVKFDPGKVKPKDISVEVYYGAIDSEGNIMDGSYLVMEKVDSSSENLLIYSGDIPCEVSGELGFAVRAVPYHSGIIRRYEPPLITWE